MLGESSYSVDIFILNNSSTKKIAVLREVSLWKSSCSEKVTASKKVTFLKKKLLKKSCFEEKLLRKSNCCVEVITLKKCEEVASLKNSKIIKKNYIKKNWRQSSKIRFSYHIAVWKKKSLIPERFPHPDKYSCGISLFRYAENFHSCFYRRLVRNTKKSDIRCCNFNQWWVLIVLC